MPAVLEGTPVQAGVGALKRKHWTRDQCQSMEAAGILDYRNYELLDGELVRIMPNRPKHNDPQMSLYESLAAAVGPGRVLVEASVDLSPEDTPTYEPQPDIVVLNVPRQSLRGAPRRPEHIALLVEVSDTTLAYDLADKALLYARAEIPEYWVLDINNRRIVVHRDPAGGRYRDVAAYAENEDAAPLACPECRVQAGALL